MKNDRYGLSEGVALEYVNRLPILANVDINGFSPVTFDPNEYDSGSMRIINDFIIPARLRATIFYDCRSDGCLHLDSKIIAIECENPRTGYKALVIRLSKFPKPLNTFAYVKGNDVQEWFNRNNKIVPMRLDIVNTKLREGEAERVAKLQEIRAKSDGLIDAESIGEGQYEGLMLNGIEWLNSIEHDAEVSLVRRVSAMKFQNKLNRKKTSLDKIIKVHDWNQIGDKCINYISEIYPVFISYMLDSRISGIVTDKAIMNLDNWLTIEQEIRHNSPDRKLALKAFMENDQFIHDEYADDVMDDLAQAEEVF